MRNLRDLREKIGLTQLQLAKASGVTQPMISLLETNSRQGCNSTTLWKLTQGLGCSLEELVNEEEMQEILRAEEEEKEKEKKRREKERAGVDKTFKRRFEEKVEATADEISERKHIEEAETQPAMPTVPPAKDWLRS